MRKLSILLLIPLVLLSGCTTQLPGVQLPGLPTGAKGGDITVSLSVDSTEIPAGNPLGLSISIENKALMPMKNVNIEITTPEHWNVIQNISGPSEILRDVIWEGIGIYTAPSNVSVDTPYKFYAKITFSMNTSRGASITLVSYDYYKRTGQKSKVSVDTPDTGGPIGIEFGQLSQMSYVYKNQNTTIPLKVILTNRGSGKAYAAGKTEPNSTYLNIVNITTTGMDCGVNSTYLMKDGSVATLMCNIHISSNEAKDINTISPSIQVSYNYIYDLVSPTITVRSVTY